LQQFNSWLPKLVLWFNPKFLRAKNIIAKSLCFLSKNVGSRDIYLCHTTMARSHPVRALTGHVRRKAKRDVADSAREMHLSTSQVGLRSLIGWGIIRAHQESRAAYATLAPLISLVIVLVDTGRNEHAIAAAYLLLHQIRRYQFSSERFKAFF
jgi:hypothetical protein